VLRPCGLDPRGYRALRERFVLSWLPWRRPYFVCAPANADTIRFGGILPLTGPGALIGTAEMHGVQFAIDQANAKSGVHGNQIEVQFENNQAKPDQSVLSFNKLTDLQHVSVIFTGYSDPSLAMAPLATRKKMLLVNAGAHADALAKASPYLINTLPTNSMSAAYFALNRAARSGGASMRNWVCTKPPDDGSAMVE
jgi:ABC-type branched-subunit amino acid transport system substrate-binding protein